MNLVKFHPYCHIILFCGAPAQIWQRFRLFWRFLDHRQLTDTTSRIPPNKLLVLRKAFTYTAHNKHKRQRSVFSAGFELAIPAMKRPPGLSLRPHGHRERRLMSFLKSHSEFKIKWVGIYRVAHEMSYHSIIPLKL